MALNASGPISLGGATTGQSINLELGQAALSVVSLNDTNVRSLGGIPSGAITMPTDFWGKSTGPGYFWAFINTGSLSQVNHWTQNPATKEYYIASNFSSTVGYSIYKINSSFTSITAQKTHERVTGSTFNYVQFTTPHLIFYNGDLYSAGSIGGWSGTNNPVGLIAKYDSSLNITSKKVFSAGSTALAPLGNTTGLLKVDSSGNIFVNSAVTSVESQNAIKFNLGTMSYISTPWNTRSFATSCTIQNIIHDTTNNFVYCTGQYSGTDEAWYLIKYNTATNSFTWISRPTVVTVDNKGSTSTAGTMVVDSSQNIFMSFWNNAGAAGSWRSIGKWNSSGANVLGKYYGTPLATQFSYIGIAIDSSNFIYSIRSNSSAATSFTLYKHDNNLVLQWQRSITLSSALSFSASLKLGIDANGQIFITMGGSAADAGMYILRYPVDGSITGSYTIGGKTITIAVSTESETTRPAEATSSMSMTAGIAPTEQTPTLPTSTPTATITQTPIP